jgi:hypothetical protein
VIYANSSQNTFSRLLLTAGLLVLAYTSRADEPRFRTRFSSPNGHYTLRVVLTRADTVRVPVTGEKVSRQHTIWGLFNNETGTQLYELDTPDFIQSKTALLANDGEDVVVVDDWSAGVPIDTWPVLSFYHRGRETQTYTLGQLLGPTYPLSESVSHFHWFAHYHFSPATATLTLQTFTLQELAFDGRSGQRLSTSYQTLVTPGSLLAYGRIAQVGTHRYELTVCRAYYGAVAAQDRLPFRSQYRLRTGDLVLALLQDGQSKHLEQRINSWWGEQVACAPATATPK